MNIIAVDPGPVESAFCVMGDEKTILSFDKIENDRLISMLEGERHLRCFVDPMGLKATVDCLIIEQIRGFGITAGNSTFDTCVATGRFAQAFGWNRTHWIPRKTIVTNLCGTAKAGDTAVREALAYRWGFSSLREAKGNSKQKGPLFGMAADEYSALAAGLTYFDLFA